MTLEEEIYEAAQKAALPGADAAILQRLCRAAQAQLEGRLREGVTVEACKDAFVCAAAFTALSVLMTQGQALGGSVESFTVGDISVKPAHETVAGTAEGYLARAEALMRPFCKPRGFAFLGVRV